MLSVSLLINSILIICLFINSALAGYIKKIIDNKKIGHLNDIEWKRAAYHICVLWSRKTPKVTLDDARLNPVDILFRFNQNTSLQSWQKAGLIFATRKVNIKEYIDGSGKWIETYTEIDASLLSYAIIKVCANKNYIMPAMDAIYNVCLSRMGNDGLIVYRKNMPDLRFVDTVGLVVPFLLVYGREYNIPAAINLAKRQLIDFCNRGLSVTGIPYHAYCQNDYEPLGITGWGRGIGWYSLGLIGAMTELDKNDEAYSYFAMKAQQLANCLLNLQKSDGGFCWNVFSPGHTETSGTAMIGLLFCECYMIFRTDQYLSAAKRCMNSIIICTKDNGVVFFSQGDSKGLGLYSSSFREMPFTQGISVCLYDRIRELEVIK